MERAFCGDRMIKLKILALVLLILGSGCLFRSVGWLGVLGIFLWTWGNNVERRH